MAGSGSGLGDKVVKDLQTTIKIFKDDLVEMNQTLKDIDGRTKAGRSLKSDMLDKTKYLADMIALVPNITGTAKTISNVAGMESGTKDAFEDKLSEMISKSEDIRVAIKRGDTDELKKMMFEKMTKMTETLEFSSEQEKEKFRLLTETINDNFSTYFDWDSILKKGESIFFPITQKIFKGAESMRKTLVTTFPPLMRVLSKDMIAHYKTGLGEVGSMIKTELAPILAPIEALVGPFNAVFKGGFMLLKTFFGKSTEYDKASAEYLHKISDVLIEEREDRIKKGTLSPTKKKGPLDRVIAWGVNLLIGVYTTIKTKLLGMFTKLGKYLSKPAGFIGKSLGKFFKLFKWIGGVFVKGLFKIITPLVGLFRGIKGAIKAFDGWNMNSIRDMILGFSSGVLSAFFELPEMIINGILGLFTDFKVDFSAQAIIDAVNNFSEWMFGAITEPVLDFFTTTLPEIFSNVFSGMVGFGVYIKDQIIDLLVSLLGNIPWIGDYVKNLENLKSGTTPSIGGSPAGKTTPPSISTSKEDKAIANANATGVGAAVSAGGSTISSIDQIVKLVEKITEHTAEKSVTIIEREIPTDTENFGLALMNTVVGGA